MDITITHCPKFDLYIATVPHDHGKMEFGYAAHGKLAMPGETIVRTYTERITKMGSRIVGYGSTRQAAELKAKLNLAKR